MSNLLGSPHLGYVQDQIKTRQEILGKTERDHKDINWANSTTSWVRLVSSVNIDDQQIYQLTSGSNEPELRSDNGKEFRNNLLGLSNYGGNQLSSQLVLQGGAQNNTTKRFNVAEENSILPSSNFNYGYGGLDFGLKPIPGITSFTSKTFDNGSLREAEVTILAHNIKQFEYLESTYLRLGYTMLLEWGNSSFPKDASTYSTTQDIAELSLQSKFLNDNGSGPSTFYTEIEKLRKKSQGNYDAFLGRVSNFSWDFNKEQQYVIKLKLISIGSVIESLKINLPSERITYPAKGLGLEETKNDPINTSFQNALINLIQTITIPPPKDPDDSETVRIPYIEGISWTKIFGKSISNNKYQNVKRDDKGNVIACFANYGNNKFYRYLKFETLLRLINSNFLLYDSEGEPALVEIDVDSDLFCYSNEYSISSDPTKMIIGFEKEITGAKIEIFSKEFSKNALTEEADLAGERFTTSMFHDIINGVKVGRIKNLFFSSEYLVQEIKSNVDKDGNLFINEFINNLLTTANNLLGGVNKLKLRLVEKTFVERDFKAVGEAKNIPSVGEFENSDAIAISDSLFQEATFTIKERVKQVIEIYDEVQPYEKQKLQASQEAIPSFKLLGVEPGKGTFVTDFSLQTTLSKDFATMISIGAQASGTSSGVDATLFSKWNRGLVDRIVPSIKDKDSIDFQKDQAKQKEAALQPFVEISNITNSYFKFLKLFNITQDDLESREISPEDQTRISILQEQQNNLSKEQKDQKKALQEQIDEIEEQQFTGYGFPDVNLGGVEGETNFINFVSIQKEFFLKALAYDAIRKQTVTPTIGFIPINLSLTFNGLSGIRIFDKLKVESKFLPNNYGDTLEFIITELDHFIENNKWYTRVGTLSIPNTIDKPQAVISIEGLSELATQVSELTDFVGSYPYPYSTLGSLILESSNSSETAQSNTKRIPGNLLIPDQGRKSSVPADIQAKTGSGRNSILTSIGKLGGVLDPVGFGKFDNIKLASQGADTRQTYVDRYNNNYFLAEPAARALVKLAQKAKNDGISFTITSAYRDNTHQQLLADLYGGTAASPGSSPHNYGGAIDIHEISSVCRNNDGKLTTNPEINKQVRENNKIYQWLKENGPTYGWYNPARLADGVNQDEAWHWEFWGVPGDNIIIRNFRLGENKTTVFAGNLPKQVPLIEENVNNTLATILSTPPQFPKATPTNPGPLYITTKGDITISE